MRPTLSAVVAVVALTGVMTTQETLAKLNLSGTVPPASQVVLIPANPRGVPKGVLKLKLTSAVGGATLGFCVGPAANPCGDATSFVVNVPPGESKLAVINAADFANGAVLIVNNPTASTVGYGINIE